MEHHPDRNGGCEDAEGRFKEINEAYSILSDPQKRAAYDRFGHAGVNGQAAAAAAPQFHDVQRHLQRGVRRRLRRHVRRPPAASSAAARPAARTCATTWRSAWSRPTPRAEVEITVPAALTCETCEGSGAKPGTSPTTCNTCDGQGRVRATQGFFSIERACPRCGGSGRLVLDPCADCRGQGQVRRERTLSVRIPAGVDDGARIRLAGEGDAGARGGPRGDLYIFLSVKPHELFERDGLDLLCTVPVPMAMAALGGEIDAPCLMGGENCDGECKIPVKVPEGAQTGRTVRLKGRGMPSLRSRERGDLVVELFIETPDQADRPPEGAAARIRRPLQRQPAPEERQLPRQGQALLGRRDGRLSALFPSLFRGGQAAQRPGWGVGIRLDS